MPEPRQDADAPARLAYQAMADHMQKRDPEQYGGKGRFKWKSLPEADKEMWRDVAFVVAHYTLATKGELSVNRA